MKKFLLFFLTLLCLSTGKTWADEITVDASTGAFTRTDNGSTGYKNLWTSTSNTPIIKVQCASQGRINPSGTTTDYYSGTYTISITNPSSTLSLKSEYVITGYKIVATSFSNESITPEGGSQTVFDTATETTLTVSDLNTTSTTFVLTDGNTATKPLSVTEFVIYYEHVNVKLYRIKSTWSSVNNWLYTDNTTANLDNLYKKFSSNSVTEYELITNPAYVFEVKMQDDQVRYLKSIHTGRYAGAPTGSNTNSGTVMRITEENNAEQFTIVDRSSGDVALKSVTNTSFYLNVYSSADFTTVGWYNETHDGDKLHFYPIKKVTFTEAVSVNGGDAVSTIYVQQGGTEVTSLPNGKLYYIDGVGLDDGNAIDAINAVGENEMTVTVIDANSNLLTTAKETLDIRGVGYPATTSVVYTNLNDAITTIENASPATVAMYKDLQTTFNAYLNYTVADMEKPRLGGGYRLKFINGSNNEVVGYVNYAEGTVYVGENSGDDAVLECVEVTDGKYVFRFAKSEKYFVYKSHKTEGEQAGVNSGKGWSDTYAADYAAFAIAKIPTSYSNVTNPVPFGCVSMTTDCRSDTYNRAGCLIVANTITASSENGGFNGAEEPYFNNSYTSAIMFEDASEDLIDIKIPSGYYNIVSACDDIDPKPALYYDQSGSIKWSTSAPSDADYRVNSIFKLSKTATKGNYTIYSPNPAKSMYFVPSSFVLGEPADFTITSAGNEKYKLTTRLNSTDLFLSVYTNNNDGLIISGADNSTSHWKLVPVNSININLNQIGSMYYATLCLPFDVTLQGNTYAYTMTLNAAGNALTLSAAMQEIPAGTPVLLINDNSGTATATIASDAPCVSEPSNETLLSGTFIDKNVAKVGETKESVDYYLGKKDDKPGFYKWEGLTLKANRAYLSSSAVSGSSIRGFDINFDTAVGIDAIEGAETLFNDASIYNLAGQRISKLQRGVNIVNGKKVIIK